MATNQGKSPISAHPLFPAVVALWFATLLGFGCLVLPAVLLDRLVSFSGISWLYPAAAPPVGLTGRIAVSLIAAIAGAVAGFVLTRRWAAARELEQDGPILARLTPRADPASRIDAVRRPISVKEELGYTMLDSPPADDLAPSPTALPGRRRALALSEDTHPDDFFSAAPLPGNNAEYLPSAPEPQIFQAPEPEPIVDEEAEPDLPGWADLPEPVSQAAREPLPPFALPIANPVLPADPTVDLETLGIVQLAERLGHSLQQRQTRPTTPAPDFAANLSGDLPPADLAVFGEAAFDAPITGAPPAAPEIPAIPASMLGLRPEFDHFDEEDEDIESSFRLPLTGFSPAVAEEDEPEDFEGTEENYSSLLTIKTPFRAPAEYAAESEPAPGARPFDGPAPSEAGEQRPDQDETERALRSALTMLRRMSDVA